jgi:oligopeptide/dipeptide ABC transporter ATP-binding protein
VSNSIRSFASSDGPRPVTAISNRPLLELRNLSTHYISAQGRRVVRAVDDVTLTINAGETLGIVGESGSGKSTLALTILRVLPPAAHIVSGQMMFEGEDLVRKSDAEMRQVRGKRIAMILQDPMASLNPLFTVGDQIAEPIRVHEGVPRATAWRRAVDLLKAVRIASPETRVRQYPHEMSGGMRQRIVGAIGMACEPRLLIADEPTTSLDLTIQAQYLNLLRDLQREHGLALIFITHNLGIVAKMCDQLAVMYAGRVVESGPVSRIFNAPAHPYTRALLNSIPRMGGNRERLTAIEGQPPNLASLPPGCAFAPRCPVAFDRCQAESPPEMDLGAGQTARCWLALPASAGVCLPVGAV